MGPADHRSLLTLGRFLIFHGATNHCHSDRAQRVEEPAVALLWIHPSTLISVTANRMHAEFSSAMDQRLYSTYIVASQSRTLYIGVSGALRTRIFQHKWKEFEGFSAKYNCDRLVWFEHYQDISKAIARETQLKKWNRAKKIALIERMNPAWVDLGRDWFEYEPADYKRATDRMMS